MEELVGQWVEVNLLCYGDNGARNTAISGVISKVHGNLIYLTNARISNPSGGWRPCTDQVINTISLSFIYLQLGNPEDRR